MLNLDTRTKSKLAWVAMLLAPVVAVQGVRTMFGVSATPSSASAAGIGPQPLLAGAPVPEPERTLTPAQAAARTWLLSRSRTLQPRSPMDRPDPPMVAPEPVSAAEPTPAPKPAQAVETPLPTMNLTAMIASSSDNQPMTMINHKAYRIGDAITPLWKVAGIDTKKRVVTLQGPDNRRVELRPPTPSQER